MPSFSFRHSTHLNSNYNVKEGETFITDISTDLPQDSVIYYQLSGYGVDDSDFTQGTTTGSAKIPYLRTITLNHTFRNDSSTEGNEQFKIKLFSDPARTIEIGSSPTWTIQDTSQRTYAFTTTPSSPSLNEGQSLTTTVRANNPATSAGQTLYWALGGNGITASDFSSGALFGSGVIGANGSFNFSHTLSNDLLSEQEEYLEVRLYLDPERSRQIGSTANAVVTINDTSKALPSYTVTPSASSVSEGDTLTTYVSTKNVNPGTTLYWSMSGTSIDASDFTSGVLSGSAKLDSNGALQFAQTLAKDLSTEGNEWLEVKVFSDAQRTQQIGSTAKVNVSDTSTTPAQFTFRHSNHLNSNYTLKEGDYFITDITTNLPQDTVVYYQLSGKGVDDSDFTQGTTTGSAKIPYLRTITLYHTFRKDLASEGDEQFSIKLFSDPARSIEIGSSPLWTIQDTSRQASVASSVPTIAIQPYVDPVTGLVNQVSEGNSRTKAITFLATLSSPSASTVTASYLTQSFDPYATGAAVATAQRDYRTAGKTITFAPGEVQKAFTISIVGDRSKEANEVFGIGLQQANGGVFSGNADSTWIAMTILNDDLA